MDIPIIQRTAFSNAYFDSVYVLTVKNLYEQLIANNYFYYENKEVIYRIIEALLFLNIQARKSNQPAILLESNEKSDFKGVNHKIIELSKQLARMEKLQGLMEEK
jgi:hypothetical protein